MGKQKMVVGLAAVALVTSLVVIRTCSPSSQKPAKTADKGAAAGKGSSSSEVGPKLPAPGAASASVVAVERRDAASEGGVVFFSPWGGSKGNHLGRERPMEGSPEGPMSLSMDAKGRTYVLDQVNGRVVRFGADGKPEGEINIKLNAAQDIAVAKDGSTAVMDRLADKSIAIYDEGGAIRGQLPLAGEGIPETGLVTGVFVDGNDVYAEREHGPLVKIGDTSGTPAEPRTEIPGRPTRDGLSYLNGGIIDGPGGRAYVSEIDRKTNEHKFTRELRLRAQIQSIVLLDTDKNGIIYFATELEDDTQSVSVSLQCLEPLHGTLLGSASMPANTMPEETFRQMTVLEDGGVMFAHMTDQGVAYTKYECN